MRKLENDDMCFSISFQEHQLFDLFVLEISKLQYPIIWKFLGFPVLKMLVYSWALLRLIELWKSLLGLGHLGLDHLVDWATTSNR